MTDKSAVKSGEKLARTICFLTPLALVRYGHNFVKRDGQIRRKIGRKTSPDAVTGNRFKLNIECEFEFHIQFHIHIQIFKKT